MKYLSIFLKAIIIGFISCAVPGLSALTFAIVLCIYYPLVDALSSVIKNFKKSILFLIFFFGGYAVGAVLAAEFVSIIYEQYPLILVIIVLGCILGSLPSMIKDIIPYAKKWTNWLAMAIVFGLFAVYSIFVVGGEEIVLDYQTMTFIDYLKLVGVAGITSITFALPGFDFAILLLALGYYYPLMELIKNLASFTDFIPNGLILLTYVSGYLIGILILSKLIKRFMSRHEGKMKFITLAFVLVSPYMVIKKSIVDNPYLLYTNNHIIIGVIGAVIGFLLVLLIYHFNNPNDTRIEAQKKRHMFRFYFTILCQFPLTIHYLKSMRKIIKEQKTSFDERYLFVQKGVAKINRLGNISLHAYGEEVIPTDVTLYVVNHQGRYDGIGILSALKDHPCSFIVDATKVKYPFYKEMSIMLECTAIDVDNPRSVVSGLKEVALQLEKGRSYIAFIEGTYGNNENNLQEFKTSVLKPAYDAKVAITPVVLYDTYKVYGKSSIRRVQPEVHFLKPISYSEYQDLTRSELAEQLKALMQIKLDDIKTEKNEFNKRKRK